MTNHEELVRLKAHKEQIDRLRNKAINGATADERFEACDHGKEYAREVMSDDYFPRTHAANAVSHEADLDFFLTTAVQIYEEDPTVCPCWMAHDAKQRELEEQAAVGVWEFITETSPHGVDVLEVADRCEPVVCLMVHALDKRDGVGGQRLLALVQEAKDDEWGVKWGSEQCVRDAIEAQFQRFVDAAVAEARAEKSRGNFASAMRKWTGTGFVAQPQGEAA